MNVLATTVKNTISDALANNNLPVSDSAVNLLMMIAAHESGGFTYCKQKGGPALGIFQMEPITYDFVLEYLDRTHRFPELAIQEYADQMVVDAEYAAAMARVYLWTKPEALPAADDLVGLAQYAKQHWNTPEGKATAEKYLNDYMTYVIGD